MTVYITSIGIWVTYPSVTVEFRTPDYSPPFRSGSPAPVSWQPGTPPPPLARRLSVCRTVGAPVPGMTSRPTAAPVIDTILTELWQYWSAIVGRGSGVPPPAMPSSTGGAEPRAGICMDLGLVFVWNNSARVSVNMNCVFLCYVTRMVGSASNITCEPRQSLSRVFISLALLRRIIFPSARQLIQNHARSGHTSVWPATARQGWVWPSVCSVHSEGHPGQQGVRTGWDQCPNYSGMLRGAHCPTSKKYVRCPSDKVCFRFYGNKRMWCLCLKREAWGTRTAIGRYRLSPSLERFLRMSCILAS